MAPIRPRARTARRTSSTVTKSAHIADKPSPSSISSTTALRNPYANPHRSNTLTTKNAKRTDKHAHLLSRLQSSTFNPSKITKSKQKPRRPKKKLVTGLEELVDALPSPDLDGEGEAGGGGGVGVGRGVGRKAEGGVGKGVGRKLQVSMKSKPGAMKKRAKVLEGERERFARNLGVMCSGSGVRDGEDQGVKKGGKGGVKVVEGMSARWAAIRRFVEGGQAEDKEK